MVSAKAPEINKEDVEVLYESKYANLYKLHYGTEGKFYYDASRRKKEDLAVVKHGEDFRNMVPDAVSCFVILKGEGEPELLLSREFRYVTGQFITGVPAGLIDEEDRGAESPVLLAAKRELFEETGIEPDEDKGDVLKIVNPLVFSTPGFTDESNALVCAVINTTGRELKLTQEGAVGKEIFSGFVRVNKEAAMKMLGEGMDDRGVYYSVYTWMSLMYFVSGMWE